MNRTVMHIDMDAFFASIEQASDPRLRGKPVIVGGRASKERTVVCAASYEAKRLGIDSAMSCAEAFRICPQAEFVAADTAKYIFTSRAIFDMLKPYSPHVEQASVDEFYLDMTGTEKFLGPVEAVARGIKGRIRSEFGITASVGISESRLFAKIASKLKKPDGLFVLEKKDIAAVLKEMPVEKIAGIGRSLTEKLNRLGVFVFSDMAKFDRDFYCGEFGKAGLWLYDVSRGEDGPSGLPSWHREDGPPKSVGHSHTLPYNAQNPELIRAWLRLLCEMVASRLRALGLEGRCLHVFLRQPDMGFISKQKRFQVPTSDGAEIFMRAESVINGRLCHGLKGFRMRALGVSASMLTPAGGSCLFGSERKRMELIRSMDEINGKYGEWTVYPARVNGIRPT